MTGNDDNLKLIADIREVLDRTPLDASARAALQRARGRALQNGGKNPGHMPWLTFALGASLTAVVAVNLPQSKPDSRPAPATPVVRNASAGKAVAALASDKPISPSAAKPQAKPLAAQAPAIDIDLLENLDLYEDAEFYEWLSEQEAQGGLDA
jgi:hypothetical protein